MSEWHVRSARDGRIGLTVILLSEVLIEDLVILDRRYGCPVGGAVAVEQLRLEVTSPELLLIQLAV